MSLHYLQADRKRTFWKKETGPFSQFQILNLRGFLVILLFQNGQLSSTASGGLKASKECVSFPFTIGPMEIMPKVVKTI